MPLIVALFLAWSAGLWCTFDHRLPPAARGVAVTVGVLASLRRRDARWALAAGAFGFASLIASDAQSHDRRCERRIALTNTATAILIEAATPGGSAVAVTAGACNIRLRLSSLAQSAPRGSVVRVEGRFRRTPRALVVRRPALQVIGRPAALARARDGATALLTRLFQDDAPMARALVLAEQQDLSAELRSTWADAGIIHMVSVSGLHVSIIATALLSLGAAAGLRPRFAELAAIAVLAGYILFIGAPAPAVRSAAMFSLTTVSRWLQRPTSAWAIWAVGSGVSLVDPRLVNDLGWQLSVAGMAGLIASGGVTARLAPGLTGWRRTIAEGMIATAIATVVTAPIVSWVFGRLSVAAVLTNLAAAPLFNVAQPLLFVAVLVSAIDPLALYLADAARGALWLIGGVARVGAAVPFAVLEVSPGLLSAVAALVLAVATVVWCATRHRRVGASAALGALALIAWSPQPPRLSREVELHVIDVGQGDALALRSPAGRWVLVDAGNTWKTGDDGLRTVLPWLRRHGGDVVHLVLTHPHADHVGGAASIIGRASVDTVWDPGIPGTTPSYLAALAAAGTTGTVWRRATAGTSFTVDGMRCTILGPDAEWADVQEDPNEASVVLRVEFGDTRFLLMGDAERGAEGRLIARLGTELDADVLKVGHHGSITSSSPEFLRRVSPALAVISVGADNDYGHPDADVLRHLDDAGASVLRTDDAGTIVISSDGRHLRARTLDSTWHFSPGRTGR